MGDEDEVAADCAMDSVDCGERERERTVNRRVWKRFTGRTPTSDKVLSSVNGVNANPTAVRAVLPTSKSPIGVSLTLPPPPPAPADADNDDVVDGDVFARKREERPMRARRRERERK